MSSFFPDLSFRKAASTVAKVVAAIAMMLPAASCSSTRSLADGEYRLAANKVRITNDDKFSTKEIQPYIKQKANTYLVFGWNPFLNVYNWSGQNGEKGMGKFFRKIGVAPVVYQPSLVTSSIENIERHLEYLGYYGSKVDGFAEVDGKKVEVTYDVTLGKRYRIDGIEFDVPEGSFREDFMADSSNISVKKGDWLSESALEAESERSAAYFRKNGYFGFTKNYFFFEADTLHKGDSSFLKMSVREYTRNQTPESSRPLKKFDFGDVTISHDSGLKFKDRILKDLCTIEPGTPYNEDDVNRTYSRLSSLRLFNGVNIELTPTDSSIVNCDIRLSESKTQGFKVDMEGSTNSNGLIGVSPQFSYFHKNIFHGGEWLNLSFLGNFQFKVNDSNVKSNEFGVSSSISLPEFLGLPMSRFRNKEMPRTEINASYNYQNRPEYTRNIISLSYGYTGSLKNGHFLYQIFPVQAKFVKLTSLDETFFDKLRSNPLIMYAYQSHFDQGTGLMGYYTTSKELNPKTSYKYARLQLDASGNFLSLFNRWMEYDLIGQKAIWATPYSQYVRAELTLGNTIKLGETPNHALAMRLLGGFGYAYGNSSRLPFDKQFYSGGANSMRGWQARALGPGNSKMDDYFVIPSQTGDMKLEANLEYRFPMFWKLCGALFTDVGNIWGLNRPDYELEPGEELKFFSFSTLGKTIAANWGFGVRVDLNFLVLRIDTGVKLYDPSLDGSRWIGPRDWRKQDSFALHFGVGYPF